MSSLPAAHGPAHEDAIIGYAIGAEGALRIEQELHGVIAGCPECVGFGYRRLADLRALAHGDLRAGVRLEGLLKASLEQMAWRDHTTAYNQLYGGPVLEPAQGRPRRIIPIAIGFVLAAAVGLAVWLSAGPAGDRYGEAIPTVEIVESSSEGARARAVHPPVDAQRAQLLRLRMDVPSPAIGQGYRWLAVLATAEGSDRLLLTADLPEEADVAIRAGVPWNQDLKAPGKGSSTGAVGALRSGEMAVVLPARLLQLGANRVRIVAATGDPGASAIAAIAAAEPPDLPGDFGRLVASTPVVVSVRPTVKKKRVTAQGPAPEATATPEVAPAPEAAAPPPPSP